MNWINHAGFADFIFNEISTTSAKLFCTYSGWSFMKGWKLDSTEFNLNDGDTYSMTLSSHPANRLKIN